MIFIQLSFFCHQLVLFSPSLLPLLTHHLHHLFQMIYLIPLPLHNNTLQVIHHFLHHLNPLLRPPQYLTVSIIHFLLVIIIIIFFYYYHYYLMTQSYWYTLLSQQAIVCYRTSFYQYLYHWLYFSITTYFNSTIIMTLIY